MRGQCGVCVFVGGEGFCLLPALVCVKLQEGDSWRSPRAHLWGRPTLRSSFWPWTGSHSSLEEQSRVTFLLGAVLFLLLCIFLSPAPLSLFHYSFMFLTLCASFFFLLSLSFLSSQAPRIHLSADSPRSREQNPLFSFSHLASLLYLSYKYWLYNYQSIISEHRLGKDTVAAKMNFRVSLVGDIFLHLSGEESAETQELS